ncbi:glycosyltransferase [Calothrix sp. FACHB-1219]|uniref:glycosyltransferase n=1 Tax=unclassified Calothrix TaxID=2619626 RepID=UPI0016885A16|nr:MULTISPECIES: glycosyltransferase [unclassified Calothrix]MBD2204051.1 glycosyltransferase [Calothrix sp. FACHB-168]MBD2221224.1 glycosyltransferase [Calothrix sp. FACHB-1219]
MSCGSQNNPSISVIIPAYNCQKTIQATIASVLNQTFTNFELIIINDGSQDSTLEIISKIEDYRLKIFSFENAGGNVSRNRGLKYAIGDFVSFLDADDIWKPDKLASQLQALQQNSDCKVAYSWSDYIDDNGKFLVSGRHFIANGDVYEQLLLNNFLENGSNPLICKEAIAELGGFDESLSAAQDWDMWLKLANKFNFVCVPSVQILYRVSANSVSSNLVRQEKACLQVIERAYKARTFDKKTWHRASANLYKYLTCKALQQPFKRHKGMAAALFLCKYFINNSSRLQRIKFMFILLLKTLIIIVLPTAISTKLLSGVKTDYQAIEYSYK